MSGLRWTVPRTFSDSWRARDEPTFREWLAGLPDSVAAQCARWDLEVDGTPWHGTNALVVPVIRGEDRFALRMTAPGDDIALEVRALEFWDGRGTVQMIAADIDRSAVLLERLDGSRSLMSVPLDEAVPILARAMVELAIPAPADVPSTAIIAERNAENFAPRWQDCVRPTSRAVLDRAIDAARRLAEEPAGDLAVDGDLHYEQVLAGTRAPWLIVDPLLMRGDSFYDLARVLWSRLDEMTTAADVVRYFDLVVDVAGLPRDRAVDWVLCRSMDYLLWGLAHRFTEDPVRCLRLLGIFS